MSARRLATAEGTPLAQKLILPPLRLFRVVTGQTSPDHLVHAHFFGITDGVAVFTDYVWHDALGILTQLHRRAFKRWEDVEELPVAGAGEAMQ